MSKIQNSKPGFRIWNIRIFNLSRISNFEFRISRKGFTLVEALVTIAILSIVTVIAFRTFIAFRNSSNLNAAVENGISLLIDARAQTISSKNASTYGVHFEPNRVIFFKGAVFSEGASGNEELPLLSAVQISKISLNGGGTDVVFKRITGETPNYGTIEYSLTSNPQETRTITVLGSGIISLAPRQSCDWAVFGEESITISGGATIDSYDSSGSGGNNQARVQTNSITPDTVTMGSNSRINGSVTVGTGGDPNTVIDLSGSALITGTQDAALANVSVEPLSPPTLPTPISPVTPPSSVGSPYSLGGGQTDTIDICVNTPSEITMGSNANLTLDGDCTLDLDLLSMDGGGNMMFNGNVGTITIDTLSVGSNADIDFSYATNMVVRSANMGGGSSISVNGFLVLIAESFTLGTNARIQTEGAGAFSIDTFSLLGGSDVIVNGNLTVNSQTFNAGSNAKIQVQGNGTIRAQSLTLTGGVDVITTDLSAAGNFNFTADTLTIGSNSKVSAQNTVTILANTFSMSGGGQISSESGKPKDVTITTAGPNSLSIGSNVKITGIIYGPESTVSIAGGADIKGSVVGKTVAVGSNVDISYDITLLGGACVW
jgi:prepilin-type N-terminal cleavage/methylation domain-containing protein